MITFTVPAATVDGFGRMVRKPEGILLKLALIGGVPFLVLLREVGFLPLSSSHGRTANPISGSKF